MRAFPILALAGIVASPAGIPGQEAAPGDVRSKEAVVAALYDVISGPAGQARDWDRFRSLFAEGARLMPLAHAEGGVRALVWTPEDYVARVAENLEERGFFETEVHRTVEEYGHVAHVFSTYESRRSPDAEPFDRGINSIQLIHDGSRWRILSVAWDSERNGHPIPDSQSGG